MYNADQTGMGTFSKMFLAPKGREKIAKRGQNYAVVGFVNSISTLIFPAFIFPRKRFKAKLMEHAGVSNVTFCQNKGWMKSDIFMKLLKYFVGHAKPYKENTVL